MSFITVEYLVFLITVSCLFFIIPHRYRWILLLSGSYYFYGSWKPEYLLLIIACTLVNFYTGLKLTTTNKFQAKLLLTLGIIISLAPLFYFKYTNFFIESINSLTSLHFNTITNLILPVGISFFTFQNLSYLIDVYKKQREPETHLGIYALYICFFPQLVAGPIESSSKLIPQFKTEQHFDYSRMKSGIRMIIWGAFKKMVIADYLSITVNQIYENPNAVDSIFILIASLFFAIQIYCDFSGYTDIALGSARILGFNLTQNFNNPYFSQSIREFWQRWHITLSHWFRDYLYINLGGNKVGIGHWLFNITLVFAVSGLWHGANLTFILWGLFHAALYILESLCKFLKPVPKFIKQIWTFSMVWLSWIFFRSNSLEDNLHILKKIFTTSPIEYLHQLQFLYKNAINLYFIQKTSIVFGLILCAILLILDFCKNRYKYFEDERLTFKVFNSALLSIAIIAILLFYSYADSDFIYFQF